jgi:hypothetical protein
MTQEVINTITSRIITDKELNDTSHLNPWILQFNGNFGIREVSNIKLDNRRTNHTLEFSIQR